MRLVDGTSIKIGCVIQECVAANSPRRGASEDGTPIGRHLIEAEEGVLDITGGVLQTHHNLSAV